MSKTPADLGFLLLSGLRSGFCVNVPTLAKVTTIR
jgi:hypothetical protein